MIKQMARYTIVIITTPAQLMGKGKPATQSASINRLSKNLPQVIMTSTQIPVRNLVRFLDELG